MLECDNCVRNGCAGACERAGEQWLPSGSEDVHCFEEDHCSRCTKDAAANGTVNLYDSLGHELCEILAAGFRGEAKEWQYRADGSICCTAFQPKDEPGLPRCPHTLELPL